MKKVLVPLARGFEEIEAVTVIDVLRRAGAEVTVAGLVPDCIEGSRGLFVRPDRPIDDVLADRFDLVVLPGGGPGSKALCEDQRVQAILLEAVDAGAIVAAICAAPTALAAAGLIRGRRITAHPTVWAELESGGARVEREQRVVVDGSLVTSQGPGTALEFAFRLVEILFGAATVAELNEGILALA